MGSPKTINSRIHNQQFQGTIILIVFDLQALICLWTNQLQQTLKLDDWNSPARFCKPPFFNRQSNPWTIHLGGFHGMTPLIPFCWSWNKSSWWVEFPTPLNKYDRQNGKSSPNRGENKNYLSCQDPDPFWLRKKLLYYKACQDMTFSKTFSFKTTNPIVGLLILQTQPESREVWRELHFPQISTLFPPGEKKYSETWRCQSFRSYVATFQHVPMCI